MRPVGVPSFIAQHNQPREILEQQLPQIRARLQKMHGARPDVSVVIPAYNEEDSILKTLSSLSASVTNRSFELIVVNNNSHDRTALLAAGAGAICIPEPVQGITAARNAGLQAAKGRLVLNADADTLYPPGWINLMTQPLEQPAVALTYGAYAFLPSQGTPRMVYFGYEGITVLSRWLNKTFREEAVNVYGFNSGFRREEALAVNGFDHPPGANEDGWLALKLRNGFSKKLHAVSDARALVWTTDRRIQADGGLVKGIFKRIKRHGKALSSA